MLGLRHISNPLVGYEITYSFNPADQDYVVTQPCSVGYTCLGTAHVKSVAHEITGDWVFSIKLTKLRPFAMGGIGVRFDVPSGGTTTARECFTSDPFICESITGSVSPKTSSNATFVYGAGLDWTLLAHLGLRFQFRGSVYRAPNLVYAATPDSLIQTSEPMAGIYVQF